jgi:hypothetical protein
VIEYNAAPPPPQFFRDQAARDFARQDVRPAQVRIEHRIDQFVRHLVRALRVRNAGVVDEDRHRTERGLGVRNNRDQILGVRHIEPDRYAGSARGANFCGEFVESLGAAPGQRHFRAGFRQHDREAAAEAGRRAGDEGDLAGQVDVEVGGREVRHVQVTVLFSR